MEGKKIKKGLFSTYWGKIIPFSIFIVLIALLIITSHLTGRSPEISSITPKVGIPGKDLIIKGRYFGDERNGGNVSFSGFSPATHSYKDWTDDMIRISIPEDINSGLLKVTTRNGESKQIIPFVNKMEIPVPLLGPLKPGEAYISSVTPYKGPVGTLVSINGLNFQPEQDKSRVYFSWISGDLSQNQKENIFSSSIPAAYYDFDYKFWSENNIKVRVPDGASSGNVFIYTNNGISNSVFFEVKEPVGQKRLMNKKVYQVYYWVKVKVLESEQPNALHIWIPGIMETPHQQEVTLISSEPGEPGDIDRGIFRFSFYNLNVGDSEQVKLRFIFKRYEVLTKIHHQKVREYYNSGAELYKIYTQSSALIPASNINIITLVRKILGKEKNPYVNAQHIYNYLLNTLTPADTQNITDSDLPTVLTAEKPVGDSPIYALLFCAFARSAGIPARPVAGYLVTSDLLSYEHYWAEFYIEDFGWVPVDLYLGDGKKISNFRTPGNPRSYYFGNLDNSRITFTRGSVNLDRIETGSITVDRTQNERRCASFQSIFEESSPSLSGYSTYWSDIGIIGFY